MVKNQEKIDSLLQALREASPDKDLDRLEDNQQAASNLRELVSELTGPVKSDGTDLDAMLAELSEKYPAPDFWEKIHQRASDALLPYQETAFLREMEETAQKEYLTAAFENMIRYQEPRSYLCETLGVTLDQLEASRKTYNTLIEWIIVSRMSRRRFSQGVQDFFGMTDSMGTFFWDLINENRAMLVERTLFSSLREMQQLTGHVSRLVELLGEAFSEDDEEDPDEDEDD